jgi:phenylalanyl-tRNA synthetase beta chain
MKGVIDELLLHLGTSAAQYRPHAGCPWLHPGQAAEIWLNGKLIGQAGMVHPNVAAQFMIPTATAWCDILVEPLLEAATPLRVFQPLPRFPAISRDLALVVGHTVTCGQLTEQIRLSGQPYLESISLFDIYQGPQVPAGMKSLAFSLVFRSRERTLVEEDIQPLIAKILESLGSRFSARLRDT